MPTRRGSKVLTISNFRLAAKSTLATGNSSFQSSERQWNFETRFSLIFPSFSHPGREREVYQSVCRDVCESTARKIALPANSPSTFTLSNKEKSVKWSTKCDMSMMRSSTSVTRFIGLATCFIGVGRVSEFRPCTTRQIHLGKTSENWH